MRLPPAKGTALVDALRHQLASRLRRPATAIDVDTPLLSYGLDSLALIEWQQEVEAIAEKPFDVDLLLNGCSLAELAQQLEATDAVSTASAGMPAPIRVPDLATPEERALWLDHQLDPSKAGYNLARAFQTTHRLTPAAVEPAFRQLALRHAFLRSRFLQRGGELVRDVSSEPCLDVRALDAASWPPALLASRVGDEAHLPFELDRGPLWRVVLFGLADSTVLLFVIHHLVADLQSMAALAIEFGTLYDASDDASDDSSCDASYGASEITTSLDASSTIEDASRIARVARFVDPSSTVDRSRQYWARQLASPLPVLDLPRDVPAPPAPSGRGGLLRRSWSRELSDAVDACALACRTTPFVVLLTGYCALLHRWTGAREVVVGCPISQRGLDGHDAALGYGVNPLPLRIPCDAEGEFLGLVDQVRGVVSAAIQHRALPLLDLVACLSRDGGPERNRDLFQTMLVVHRDSEHASLGACLAELDDERFMLGALECRVVPVARRVSLMDLRVEIVQAAGAYHVRLEYSTDRCSAETVESLAASFEVLIRIAAADTGIRLGSLPLLDGESRRRIVVDWNRTTVPYPSPGTIHQVIERQARRTPDALAVVFEERTLRYRELDRKATAVARQLVAFGVTPETFVGVLVERSLEAVVAFLAVLKAGAAFVPLDPTDPAARLEACIADARVSVVLTHGSLGDRKSTRLNSSH